MSNVHRTSRGDAVDMDMLRLANESTIAVGNMRTNARGDELGSGGKVVRTRAQVMSDYHKLNTSVPQDDAVSESAGLVAEPTVEQVAITNLVTPTVEDTPVVESTATPAYVKPRGSFADSVAKETEVNQDLLDPAASRSTPSTGVSRI